VKQNLPLSELARIANLSPEEATPILGELTRQRLLRRFEPRTGDETAQASYELTHDYLVNRIADWLGESFWAAQKVRELVRLALPEWQDRGRLLPIDDLRLITLQRQNVRFTQAELELIYATAVGYDDDPLSWQPQLADDVCRAILLQLLGNREGFVRREAAHHLADFPAQNVADALAETALADSDASVRRQAAESIARFTAEAETGQTAISRLVSATTDPARADAAYQALVTVRDLEPVSQALFPQTMQQPILRRVWRARWRRHRSKILDCTIRGIQGGFLGFGVGMGLFLGLGGAIESGFDLQILFQNTATTIRLMTAGMPLAAIVGVLAAGPSAFVGELLRNLQDQAQPWVAWLAQTTIGGIFMSLGFILLTFAFAGNPAPLRAMTLGLILGLLVIGACSAPIRASVRMRLAIAILVSIGAFFLTNMLGLVTVPILWWNIFMGAISGLGLFWGFRET
jgi:hypothetical protein